MLSTNKLLSCYLFGSYAKGKQSENSDVDILIIVDKEQYEYKQITNMKEQIKNEFGFDSLSFSFTIMRQNATNRDGHMAS